MTPPLGKPPEAGTGGEGPVRGAPFTSANGWNYLTKTLHTRAPQALRQTRLSVKSIDHLIRTGR